MGAIPTLTLKVGHDLLYNIRYRWILYEDDKVFLRGLHRFETRAEAEADGDRALRKREAELRMLRPPE